jgi:citrate lyase subunit beta-like protein
VLDIEDGVALNRKQQARENISNLYDTDARVQNDLLGKYTVRINAPLSYLAKEDIKTLFDKKPKKSQPKCLFIPKTNSADDITWLYERLDQAIETSSSDQQLNLYFYMESALSLVNLKEIIETANRLTNDTYGNRFNLEGFVFGSDDFCADISAARTHDAYELIYARQKLITYCKNYYIL